MTFRDLPKILVCTPVLNRAWIIKYMLESFLKQNYPKELMRIVIVDGGSTDGTPNVARKILENSNIRYKIIVKETNVAEARNLCIDNLEDEEVVIMWESDNLAPADAVKIIVEVLNKTSYDVIGVSTKFIKIKEIREINKYMRELNKMENKSYTIIPVTHVPGAFMAIRSKIFKEGLRFNSKMTFHDDVEFGMQCLFKGICIGKITNFYVLDIDFLKKKFSDIYIDMPLKRYIQGIIPKARSFGYEIAFSKHKKYLFRASYSVLNTTLLALLIIGILIKNMLASSILLIMYMLNLLVYLVKKINTGYSLAQAMKGYIRSIIILSPMHILTILYTLYHLLVNKRLVNKCLSKNKVTLYL